MWKVWKVWWWREREGGNCRDVLPPSQLLAVLIKSLLRVHHGDCGSAGPLLVEACSFLEAMLGDSTPVVLKAACEALQLCLPSLATSSQPLIG